MASIVPFFGVDPFLFLTTILNVDFSLQLYIHSGLSAVIVYLNSEECAVKVIIE
jgi:hypothetical protein